MTKQANYPSARYSMWRGFSGDSFSVDEHWCGRKACTAPSDQHLKYQTHYQGQLSQQPNRVDGAPFPTAHPSVEAPRILRTKEPYTLFRTKLRAKIYRAEENRLRGQYQEGFNER